VCYNISIKVKRLTDVTVKRLVMNRFDDAAYEIYLDNLVDKYWESMEEDVEETEEDREYKAFDRQSDWE